jgi:hypothetical protein
MHMCCHFKFGLLHHPDRELKQGSEYSHNTFRLIFTAHCNSSAPSMLRNSFSRQVPFRLSRMPRLMYLGTMWLDQLTAVDDFWMETGSQRLPFLAFDFRDDCLSLAWRMHPTPYESLLSLADSYRPSFLFTESYMGNMPHPAKHAQNARIVTCLGSYIPVPKGLEMTSESPTDPRTRRYTPPILLHCVL